MRTQTMRIGPGSPSTMVRWLLMTNGAVFFLQVLAQFWTGAHFGLIRSGDLAVLGKYFALVPPYVLEHGFVWQLISYQFLHGGFWHILINMLVLWMFGVELERVWGSAGFLRFYLTCGVAAGLAMIAFNYTTRPTVGASGAIFGLLGAFALYWPEREVFVWGIFPIKVKYFVLIIGAIELFGSFHPMTGGVVAHMAHLGGLFMGLAYVWFGDPREPLLSPLYEWMKQRRVEQKKQEWEEHRKRREDMVREADEILDRLQEMDWEDLPEREKRRIREISDELDDFE